MRILVDKETGQEYECYPNDLEGVYWAIVKPVKPKPWEPEGGDWYIKEHNL